MADYANPWKSQALAPKTAAWSATMFAQIGKLRAQNADKPNFAITPRRRRAKA
jgi:hypothetical protein